jgi:hypothetical protein
LDRRFSQSTVGNLHDTSTGGGERQKVKEMASSKDYNQMIQQWQQARKTSETQLDVPAVIAKSYLL